MNDGRTIGSMDTLIEIQQGKVVTNSVGAKRYVFELHSRVFASIDASDTEGVSNGNLAEGASLSVTIYKIGGLDTRWRVVIAGKPYQIDSLDNISRTSPICTLRVSSINETL